MRSLAEQDVAELGGRLSILWRQKRDHVRLDALLDALGRSEPGVEQQLALRRVARLVFPHAFAEDSVLWPVARRALPGGEALTLRVEEEHQEVNELWTALEADGLEPAHRQATLRRLAEVLREDVRDEEDRLLPEFQAKLDPRSLRTVGLVWEVVRRTHRPGRTRWWPADHRATSWPRCR